MKRLVYDFWAYDIPTQVAMDTLRELEIPFTVKKERQVRDPSAPAEIGRYDDWAKIYVDPEVLIKWLEKRIDDEIRNY